MQFPNFSPLLYPKDFNTNYFAPGSFDAFDEKFKIRWSHYPVTVVRSYKALRKLSVGLTAIVGRNVAGWPKKGELLIWE